jgi:predicted phosphate transport protein (TIGR00153 family)
MSINRIFQILVPKDKKFIPLFEDGADNLVKGAQALNKFFITTDKAERENIISQIKEMEKQGDDITHQIYDELNKTFITPFDREDIYKLNGSIDDVMDFINSVSQKFRLHAPKESMPAFLELSELILQAAREIKTAISELRNLKNPKKIMESCIRINEIENQADEIYHGGLSYIFENQKDAIELIKIKEVLATLEKATDKEEDVSDVIKSILVKIA